jgi:hypothetical protein
MIMKICPVCGVELEDNVFFCPECGAKYVESDVKREVASEDTQTKSESEATAKAASMEIKGLNDIVSSKLSDAPLPKMSETFRQMGTELNGMAMSVLFVAGRMTDAHIFDIIAIVFFILTAGSFVARSKGQKKIGTGEIMVRAAISLLTNDASALVERYPKNADVPKQLDMMKKKADEALARQLEAKRRNRRKIRLIALAVFLVFAAGVAVMAVQKHARDKAAIEYATQPE